LVYNITLSPIEDVEYLAEIDNIYFDFDKSNIRADAAKELDKLVDLMKNEYPELAIEIGSHTDFRRSERYNEALSKRRKNPSMSTWYQKGSPLKGSMRIKATGEQNPR